MANSSGSCFEQKVQQVVFALAFACASGFVQALLVELIFGQSISQQALLENSSMIIAHVVVAVCFAAAALYALRKGALVGMITASCAMIGVSLLPRLGMYQTLAFTLAACAVIGMSGFVWYLVAKK